MNSNPCSPMWLLGDSFPDGLDDSERVPLNPRHPTRHNIWTPILLEIQRVPSKDGLWLDDNLVYIKNAVKDADEWDDADKRKKRIQEFRSELLRHKPPIVITFGGRAFEFSRPPDDSVPKWQPSRWNCDKLGKEFQKVLRETNEISIFPLLHASIARQWLKAHALFTRVENANYFEYCGREIGRWLLGNRAAFERSDGGCLLLKPTGSGR